MQNLTLVESKIEFRIGPHALEFNHLTFFSLLSDMEMLMIKLHISGCTNLYLLLFDSVIMEVQKKNEKNLILYYN